LDSSSSYKNPPRVVAEPASPGARNPRVIRSPVRRLPHINPSDPCARHPSSPYLPSVDRRLRIAGATTRRRRRSSPGARAVAGRSPTSSAWCGNPSQVSLRHNRGLDREEPLVGARAPPRTRESPWAEPLQRNERRKGMPSCTPLPLLRSCGSRQSVLSLEGVDARTGMAPSCSLCAPP
jgi:hypothetical protein